MAIACSRPCVDSYQDKVGKNFDSFVGKLDQLEDFAECITAISAIVMLCLPKFNTSPILMNVTGAIGATGAVTTLLIVAHKFESVVTGKITQETDDEGKLIGRSSNISLLIKLSSLVARVASTALVLQSFGVFSLGAHRVWIATTVVASLSSVFILGVIETATKTKDWDSEKKAKLTGRILFSLAIPGAFGLVPDSCPLPIRVTALAVAAMAFGFSFTKDCYTFEDSTKKIETA